MNKTQEKRIQDLENDKRRLLGFVQLIHDLNITDSRGSSQYEAGQAINALRQITPDSIVKSHCDYYHMTI